MRELTERQKEVLEAIIREYMDTAIEVGSNLLVEKYNLGVSSATIRSEMVNLMDMGFLEKSHISSGRIPTDQALRMYVKEFVDEETLSPIIEVNIQQDVFRDRFDREKLIKAILEILTVQSKSASFFASTGFIRYHGLSSLMRFEELKNIDVIQRVLDLLEDEDMLIRIFSKYPPDEVGLIIGEESGIKDLE